METPEIEKGKSHIIVEIIQYIPNAVLSKTIIKKKEPTKKYSIKVMAMPTMLKKNLPAYLKKDLNGKYQNFIGQVIESF